MWHFIKKEIAYVDKLNEWAKTKVWEYNLLDRVWVIETCEQALSRLPWYQYTKKSKKNPIEWIIIWETYEAHFSRDTEFKKFEKMTLGWVTSDWCVVYHAPWYKVLLKNWKIINWYEVKKSHWEFQEEFEHLSEVEKKKQEVLEAQKRYEETLNEMDSLLNKWRELQNKLINKVIK